MYLLLGCSQHSPIFFSSRKFRANSSKLSLLLLLKYLFLLCSFLGLVCKQHADHGQHLAPWKVWTTQEGAFFRDCTWKEQRVCPTHCVVFLLKKEQLFLNRSVFFFLQVITDDDVDRISLCVRVVAERVPLMKNIFTVECRNSLSSMLDANKRGEEEKMNKVICFTITWESSTLEETISDLKKIEQLEIQCEHSTLMRVVLKELRHRSCILKKMAKLFKIRFNFLHSQPSLFLFVLESLLWCLSSLANHYF